jgi:hypothetical protein
MVRKITDHKGWFEFLTQEGWTVHYFPVVVTHSGLIPSTAAAALQQCGVEHAAARRAVGKIIHNTLASNYSIRTVHRKLFRQVALPGQPP